MVNLNNLSKWDYPRFVFSFLLLTFATVLTFYAIFTGNTTFYDAVPPVAAFFIFLFNLILLGIMEGLQIALVELKRQHPDSYKNTHPRAYDLGQRASHKDNVERFLMGRQVFVIFIVFFTSKITTVYLEDFNDFLWPVSKWFYYGFLDTGFLTCILVVIVGQLMPQIVAAKYPVHFLSIFVMKYAFIACIVVEASGITHFGWLLSDWMAKVFGITGDLESEGLDKDMNVIITAETAAGTDNASFSSDGPPAISFSEDKTNGARNIVKTLEAEINPDIAKILTQYLNAHPEKFYNFPSIIGNKVYPSPNDLAVICRKADLPIPDFLRAVSDPKHVPPHVVAWELLLTLNDFQKKATRDTSKEIRVSVF